MLHVEAATVFAVTFEQAQVSFFNPKWSACMPYFATFSCSTRVLHLQCRHYQIPAGSTGQVRSRLLAAVRADL